MASERIAYNIELVCEMAKHLGLEHLGVRNIDLKMGVDKVLVATVELIVPQERVKNIAESLKAHS